MLSINYFILCDTFVRIQWPYFESLNSVIQKGIIFIQ